MSKYDFFAQKKITGLSTYIISDMYKKLERIFFNNFNDKGINITEIGPGKGAFTKICHKKKGIFYQGYEPNTLLYKNLIKKGYRISNKTVPPLDEKSNTQDAVILLHVLEHMPSSAIAEELINEIYRILKPGGIIFLAFPSYLSWKQNFFNMDYTHSFITTELNVSQLLTDYGLIKTSTYYFYGNLFNGFGQLINNSISLLLSILTFFLPRKITRSEKFQKMGITFAENILMIAEKPIEKSKNIDILFTENIHMTFKKKEARNN